MPTLSRSFRLAKVGAQKTCLYPAAAGFVLLVVTFLLTTLEYPTRFLLPSADIRADRGFAFVVVLNPDLPWPFALAGATDWGPGRSRLVLFEDDVKLGPPEALHDRIRAEGRGAFSHWQNRLYLSASDNTNPASNGRTYSVLASATIPRGLLLLAFASGVFLLMLAGVLLCRQQWAVIASSTQAAIDRAASRAVPYAVGAAIPTCISAAWLLRLPAYWKGTDSTLFFVWQWQLVPHYPPLYAGFMALVVGTFGVHPLALYAVQAVQHIVLVLANAYLANAFRQTWKIVLVSALASVGSGLHVYAHGVMTEGLAVPFIIIFFGALLRLHLGGWRWTTVIVAFLSLLLATQARHASIFLGLALPLYWLLRVVGPNVSQRMALLRALVASFVVLACTYVVSEGLTRTTCFVLGSNCTSIVGRAGVYRILETVALVPEAERSAWLDSIAAPARSPEVATALRLMASVPNPWLDTRNTIASSPDLWHFDPDDLMNRAFVAFLLSSDGYANQQWRKQLAIALLTPGGDDCGRRAKLYSSVGAGTPPCGTLGQSWISVSINSIATVYPTSESHQMVAQRLGILGADALHDYARARDSVVVLLQDLLHPYLLPGRLVLLGLSLALTILATILARRTHWPALLATVWLTAVAYVALIALVTVILRRYMAPFDLLVWLEMGLAVIAIADAQTKSKPYDALVT